MLITIKKKDAKEVREDTTPEEMICLLKPKVPSKVPAPLRRLINFCLQTAPEKRPLMEDIIQYICDIKYDRSFPIEDDVPKLWEDLDDGEDQE